MAQLRSRPDRTGPPRPGTRRWHRYLGLTGAAFLLLLVTTGILLGHPESLGLDRRFVTASPMLRLYGIKAPSVNSVYSDARATYAELDGRTFRVTLSGATTTPEDTHELDEVEGQLLGVAAAAEVSLVATQSGVWLYDLEGRFVDRFEPPGSPRRLGRLGENLVIESDRGRYRADASLVDWRPTTLAPDRWSMPRSASAEEARAIEKRYLAAVLSWERVLLDLHSGRLFGRFGPYVVDAAALVLLVTAITGLILAFTPRNSQNP